MADPDETPRRRSRRLKGDAALEPQQLSFAGGEEKQDDSNDSSIRLGTNSTTSTLTTATAIRTTPRSARRYARRVHDRDNITLFQLSNVPSPDKSIDAIKEELLYDEQCRLENAGASDSEEDSDVEDDGVEEETRAHIHQRKTGSCH